MSVWGIARSRESDSGGRDDEDMRDLLAVERRSRQATGQEGRADGISPGMGRPHAGRNRICDEILEGEKMSNKIVSYPGREITAEEIRKGKVLESIQKVEPRYNWAAGVAISRFLVQLKNERNRHDQHLFSLTRSRGREPVEGTACRRSSRH